jgi:myo-inositol-1(or 4)-monophosphatase
VRGAVLPLLGTEAGGQELGRGAGGDRTVELDRRAEIEVLAELKALAGSGERFSVLSEEAGLIDMGAPFPRVLVDPVDGSRNAKRGIPLVGLILALMEGPTLAQARIGFVLNTVSGERWHSLRGGGSFRDGRRFEAVRHSPEGRIGVLSLETSTRSFLAAGPLIELSGRLRMLGSTAIALAHTATGGVDVHCTPTPHRVFDMTAGVLMIEEVGGLATDAEGRPLSDLPADLETYTTALCSAHRDLHRLALEALAR